MSRRKALIFILEFFILCSSPLRPRALRAKGKIDKWGLATLGIAHHCVGNAKEALSRLEEVSGTDVFAGNGEEAGLLCWRLGILYEEAVSFLAASHHPSLTYVLRLSAKF